MGKYSTYRQVKPKKWEVHPIWRGIGCILLVLIPLLAYAGALVLAPMVPQWINIPPELNRYFSFNEIFKYVPTLREIFPNLPTVYVLNVALTVALSVVGFGLVSIVYTLMYSMMGASVKSPIDAPPIRSSPRKRRR